MKMTKQEFKDRWESNDNGGGISYNDIADCAVAWGISRAPKGRDIVAIRYQVLVAAGTVDAEEFAPEQEEA
jgi:hypothetical protein